MSKVESVVWMDVNGFLRIAAIRTNTGGSSIVNALANAVNAQPYQTWEGNLVQLTPVPGTNVYSSGQVVATMTFLCADSTEAKLNLFAPPLALFQSDERTIDNTNPLVVSIISTCIGNLESSSGSLATSYLSGVITQGGL